MRIHHAVLGLFASLVLAPAQRAHACSPPLPGLYSTRPASGGTLPANAAIQFDGYGPSGFEVSLEGVMVTVDGSPATLTRVEALDWSVLAKVTPEPAAGATINIRGTFCPPENNCQEQALTFTVRAPDNSVPDVPALEVNLHDHADFLPGVGFCGGDAAASWWFHFKGDTAGAADAEVFHRVEISRNSTFATVFRTLSRVADAADVFTGMHLDDNALGNADPTRAFCFRAFSVDTAGHRSAFSPSTCRPCHVRVDPQVDAGSAFGLPPEPDWTGADILAGGQCSDVPSSSSGGGSSGTPASSRGGVDGGEDDLNIDPGPGCGCRGSAGTDAAWGMGLMLAGLAALTGRRRARAQSTSARAPAP